MTEFDDDDNTPSRARSKGSKATARKYEDEQLKLDVQAIMRTPAGRRYVNHLLEFGGVNRTSFTGNSTTFFNEGARNFALKITGDVKAHAAGDYLLMQQEAMNEND